MKVYVPFFICSIILLFVVIYLYSPIYNFEVRKNIYGYKNESLKAMNDKNINVDKYYEYIDCNVSNENFEKDNLKIYKQISGCDIEISKVNTLATYFENKEVLALLEINFDYTMLTKDNYENIYKIVTNENYLAQNFERYLNYEGSKKVLNVNLDHDKKSYVDFKTVFDISETTIVNNHNRLNEYNKSLVYCNGYYLYSTQMCTSLMDFLQELRDVEIDYSIKKFFSRQDLFDEHATGLAFNLEYDYSFDNYVEEIASKHGFIMRYKAEYSDVIDIVESGHFRYVGVISSDVYHAQVCLEEYLYYN